MTRPDEQIRLHSRKEKWQRKTEREKTGMPRTPPVSASDPDHVYYRIRTHFACPGANIGTSSVDTPKLGIILDGRKRDELERHSSLSETVQK